jgi:hypothetical protein
MGLAALLPLLVMSGSLAHGMMRCRFTGAATETCACPPGAPENEQAQPRDASWVDEDCCEWRAGVAVDAVREAATQFELALPRPTTIATLRLDLLHRPRQRALPIWQSHRASGPPIVLVKSAFLI